MSDSKDMVLKIMYAFEDLYFEEGKAKIFDDIFSKYFCMIDIEHHMDIYDVLTLLRTKHRAKFDEMVCELKSHFIMNDD